MPLRLPPGVERQSVAAVRSTDCEHFAANDVAIEFRPDVVILDPCNAAHVRR